MSDEIDHLDAFNHVVLGIAHPSNGRTIYGGRCVVCGAAFGLYNREYAAIRLAQFKQEPCKGPPP